MELEYQCMFILTKILGFIMIKKLRVDRLIFLIFLIYHNIALIVVLNVFVLLSLENLLNCLLQRFRMYLRH
jgi:hypothetical protein